MGVSWVYLMCGLNRAPQKRHVDVLNPSAYKWELIWRYSLAMDQVEMMSYWIMWAGTFIKRGKFGHILSVSHSHVKRDR